MVLPKLMLVEIAVPSVNIMANARRDNTVGQSMSTIVDPSPRGVVLKKNVAATVLHEAVLHVVLLNSWLGKHVDLHAPTNRNATL